jgi:glycosyltransferase involved in cell wall biosynthesis
MRHAPNREWKLGFLHDTSPTIRWIGQRRSRVISSQRVLAYDETTEHQKNHNMKLAINAGILDDRLSGLGVYTINVISSLASLMDVDISIYTAKPEALSVINDANVHLIPSIVQPKYGKVAGLARFIWNQFVFPFLVAKRDLIYCTTHHGILWGCGRQVITVHDLLPVKFPDQYRLQTAYYKYLLPILIKRAAAVITISENTKRDLHEQYGLAREKVHVVYNGLDHDRFFVPAVDVVARFKKKYSLGNYLLIVGASFPHKNVGAALRAFHQAQTRLPNTELVITGGRKEYTDELKRVVKDLDVKRVQFLEYVPTVELPALYAGATALVYPSLYEGFGFPPLEAMACGCPVIVSNTSSLPEVCGGAVYYFDPRNNEEMANVMVAIVSDIGLQMRLKGRGLLRAKSFSWDKTALGIYDILTEVAGEAHTSRTEKIYRQNAEEDSAAISAAKGTLGVEDVECPSRVGSASDAQGGVCARIPP